MGLLAIIVFVACGQTIADNPQNPDVLAVLKKFQAGYDKRDIFKVDEYVRDLFDSEDVLVIGTRAYASGDGEWCEGIDKVKEIVKWDWQYWDDLRMETEKARIRVDGNTAWVAFWGTLVSRQTKEKGYSDGVKNILGRQKEKKYKENPREFFLVVQLFIARGLGFRTDRCRRIHSSDTNNRSTNQEKRKMAFQTNDFLLSYRIPQD